MTRVVVASVIANKPGNAGNAWVVLSWLRGLQKLGVEVHFMEQIDAEACLDDTGGQASFGESANLDYFCQTMADAGLTGRSTLLSPRSADHAASFEQAADIAAGSDLLVNISGHLGPSALTTGPRRRAFVDLDPGYTQAWHLLGSASVPPHDTYFTVGVNVPTDVFTLPNGDVPWRPLRQPVVLEDWPEQPADAGLDGFTTVASWRGAFGRVDIGGRSYGGKAHEFRKFLELPDRCAQDFELALDIHPGDQRDLEALQSHGWKVRDPGSVVRTPAEFRRYVQASSAEFSVAQGIYVDTCSGWFSDRTTRYLASGRPALVQDTGFTGNLPVGDGLLPFRTPEEALLGVRRLEDDYAHHARSARRVAEECFDSDAVLTAFLEQAL